MPEHELRTPGGVTLRCRVADRFVSRFLGLMGRAALPAGHGVLFVPGGSIHTFFMRFALDAVFIGGEGTALRVTAGLRPWRLAGAPRGTRFVLELTAGQAAACGLEAGAQLEPADGDWAALAGRRRFL